MMAWVKQHVKKNQAALLPTTYEAPEHPSEFRSHFCKWSHFVPNLHSSQSFFLIPRKVFFSFSASFGIYLGEVFLIALSVQGDRNGLGVFFPLCFFPSFPALKNSENLLLQFSLPTYLAGDLKRLLVLCPQTKCGHKSLQKLCHHGHQNPVFILFPTFVGRIQFLSIFNDGPGAFEKRCWIGMVRMATSPFLLTLTSHIDLGRPGFFHPSLPQSQWKLHIKPFDQLGELSFPTVPRVGRILYFVPTLAVRGGLKHLLERIHY